jgi:hypothetical protein
MNPPSPYGEGSCTSWNPGGNMHEREADAHWYRFHPYVPMPLPVYKPVAAVAAVNKRRRPAP